MSILIERLHINCDKSCLFGCQQIGIIVKTTVNGGRITPGVCILIGLESGGYCFKIKITNENFFEFVAKWWCTIFALHGQGI